PGAPPEDLPGVAPGVTGQGEAGSRGSPSASGISMAGAPSGSASGGQSSGGAGTMAAEGDPQPRQRRPLRVPAPMEIVVVCGPTGVTIHPGGYQLSTKTLNVKNDVLARSLKTIVQQRQQVDPMIRPVPSIRFLVEARGGESYRAARRQTVLSGLDW